MTTTCAMCGLTIGRRPGCVFRPLSPKNAAQRARCFRLWAERERQARLAAERRLRKLGGGPPRG